MTFRTLAQLVVGAWLVCAWPGTLLAQTSAPRPLAESLSGDALEAYDAAKLLFEDGDAAGALTKFSRAYDIAHEPRLLWNMAVCEKELRHYANAARDVNRYLAEASDKISPESRSGARATLQALRAFYSDLTLVDLPPGAHVSVDGASAGTAPLRGAIPIDLGRRRVRVEQAGFEPFERLVEAPGAAAVSLKVELTPLPASAVLSVASSEPKDVIALDGKVVGSGHWQGSVPPGEHVVRVTAPGKKAYERHVQLALRARRDLQVGLEPEGKPLWPWIAGGAVALVGVGVGGYFLLKPDAGAGDDPHGKLGTVYIPLGRGAR